MCGICGIAGPGITNYDIEVLKQLAWVNGLRGTDSTGIFQGKTDDSLFKPNHKLLVQKNALDVAFFMQYHTTHKNGNHEIFSDIFNNFFCVHTRSATRGAINTANAHPFEFDRFVGCHNGTLVDEKYTSKDKTDSELFIQDINDHGILPVLRELDPDSAYAIVLYNKETGELSFARNHKRPLFVAHHSTRAVMYWSSEKEAIEFIAERMNLTLLDGVKTFSAHQIYMINPAKIPAKTAKIFTVNPFVPKPSKIKYTEWTSDSLRGWQARQESKGRKSENSNPEDIADFELVDGIYMPAPKKEETKAIPHLRLVPKTLIPKPKKGMIVKNKDAGPSVPIIPRETLVPEHYCCSCMKPMTPMEQYYAYKITDNIYVHEHCKDALQDQINLENKPETEVHVG